jgi:hypothetical protein
LPAKAAVFDIAQKRLSDKSLYIFVNSGSPWIRIFIPLEKLSDFFLVLKDRIQGRAA